MRRAVQLSHRAPGLFAHSLVRPGESQSIASAFSPAPWLSHLPHGVKCVEVQKDQATPKMEDTPTAAYVVACRSTGASLLVDPPIFSAEGLERVVRGLEGRPQTCVEGAVFTDDSVAPRGQDDVDSLLRRFPNMRIHRCADEGSEIAVGRLRLTGIQAPGVLPGGLTLVDNDTDCAFVGHTWGAALPQLTTAYGLRFCFPAAASSFHPSTAVASIDHLLSLGVSAAFLRHFGLATDLPTMAGQLRGGIRVLESLGVRSRHLHLSGHMLADFIAEEAIAYTLNTLEQYAIYDPARLDTADTLLSGLVPFIARTSEGVAAWSANAGKSDLDGSEYTSRFESGTVKF